MTVAHHPTRRHFIERAAVLGGLAGALSDRWLAALFAQVACDEGPAGDLVRVLPVYGGNATETPLRADGRRPRLDARLFTDLSQLAPNRLVTPIDSVYVRTAAPPGLRHEAAAWTLTVRASPAPTAASRLSATDLASAARPMGPHVIECAGNGNPQNFGLMSAVEWDGVPLERLLDKVPRPPGATAVLVSGVDDGRSTRVSPCPERVGFSHWTSWAAAVPSSPSG